MLTSTYSFYENYNNQCVSKLRHPSKNIFKLQLTRNIWFVARRGTKYAFAHFCEIIPFFPFSKQLLQKISGFSANETCDLSQTPNALPNNAHGTYITFTGTQ
jgi:hypothetical protein